MQASSVSLDAVSDAFSGSKYAHLTLTSSAWPCRHIERFYSLLRKATNCFISDGHMQRKLPSLNWLSQANSFDISFCAYQTVFRSADAAAAAAAAHAHVTYSTPRTRNDLSQATWTAGRRSNELSLFEQLHAIFPEPTSPADVHVSWHLAGVRSQKVIELLAARQ